MTLYAIQTKNGTVSSVHSTLENAQVALSNLQEEEKKDRYAVKQEIRVYNAATLITEVGNFRKVLKSAAISFLNSIDTPNDY